MTLTELRNFHEQPTLIALWQKLLGPALRWLTPARRRLLLAVAAIWVAVRRPAKELSKNRDLLGAPPQLTIIPIVIVALFGLVLLAYFVAKRLRAMPAFVRKHPQICWHGVFWSLLISTWTTHGANPLIRAILIGCALGFPFILWRVGYMLLSAERGKMQATRFVDHLFYIFPVWRGTDTPYGKGHDYLSANEARDPGELAKSQLAGIKLFLLAALWSLAKYALDAVVFAEEPFFGIAAQLPVTVPHVGKLIANPGEYPRWLSWIALYVDLVSNVLSLAIKGHVIIGWLRMFGFNVFCNTYRPLLAETVVEFWNRYYYYFKELLVNFFFYPTFARYFKKQPRARIVFAVFAAAFAGNIYYHALELDWALIAGDFPRMWTALASRVFYCFLLATGISVSMLRQRGPAARAKRPLARRIVAIFGVWTFFSILHIWSRAHPAPFSTRMEFFLRLVGIA